MSVASSLRCVRCVACVRLETTLNACKRYADSWRCYLAAVAADVAGGDAQRDEMSFIVIRVCSSESHLTNQQHNFTNRLTNIRRQCVHNYIYTNKWASMPNRWNVFLCHYTIHTFVHIWPWPLTSDLENLMSNSHSYDEYLRQVWMKLHEKYVNRTDRRTDGRTDGRTAGGWPENTMPPPPTAGGKGITLLLSL